MNDIHKLCEGVIGKIVKNATDKLVEDCKKVDQIPFLTIAIVAVQEGMAIKAKTNASLLGDNEDPKIKSHLRSICMVVNDYILSLPGIKLVKVDCVEKCKEHN